MVAMTACSPGTGQGIFLGVQTVLIAAITLLRPVAFSQQVCTAERCFYMGAQEAHPLKILNKRLCSYFMCTFSVRYAFWE